MYKIFTLQHIFVYKKISFDKTIYFTVFECLPVYTDLTENEN